jgi:hypothetical protein
MVAGRKRKREQFLKAVDVAVFDSSESCEPSFFKPSRNLNSGAATASSTIDLCDDNSSQSADESVWNFVESACEKKFAGSDPDSDCGADVPDLRSGVAGMGCRLWCNTHSAQSFVTYPQEFNCSQ